MTLYFAEGGNSDKVLGLTHVLLETDEATIDDYIFAGAGVPRKYARGWRRGWAVMMTRTLRRGRRG